MVLDYTISNGIMQVKKEQSFRENRTAGIINNQISSSEFSMTKSLNLQWYTVLVE